LPYKAIKAPESYKFFFKGAFKKAAGGPVRWHPKSVFGSKFSTRLLFTDEQEYPRDFQSGERALKVQKDL